LLALDVQQMSGFEHDELRAGIEAAIRAWSAGVVPGSSVPPTTSVLTIMVLIDWR
jgi:hypothetical protein